MQKINLSKRMAAVAGLVPFGVNACDIGCDHGFVAIYLVREGICPKVIAMDINKGPLSRAKEHIESAGLSSYIETRLSDGMEKLDIGEAECVIAAGMGGRLVVKILEDHPEKRESLRYLVLQPQSELAFVRAYLRRQGFVIRKEDMVFEDGKFYPMMLAEVSGREDICSGAMNEAVLEDEFGPCLIRERHPVLLEYLFWWEGQQNKILKEVLAYPERREQVEEELARIREVRRMMRSRSPVVCVTKANTEPEKQQTSVEPEQEVQYEML